MVVLPLPVAPMNATVSPFDAVKLTSCRTYPDVPGYLNETFLNSTDPSRGASAPWPSLMEGSVLMTSWIRLEATMARGRIMKIMTSMMKDMTTCIA